MIEATNTPPTVILRIWRSQYRGTGAPAVRSLGSSLFVEIDIKADQEADIDVATAQSQHNSFLQ